MRRSAAAGAGLLVGQPCSASQGEAGGKPEKSPPNVLLILTDQLRYDVFSFRDHPVVKTPHIDRLAARGTVFTDATCTAPLCGPARAGLLTGCFAYDGKYQMANREPSKPSVFLVPLTTADEALEAADYHVEYHGKWHTGEGHRSCYRNRKEIFGHRIFTYRDFLAAKYEMPEGAAYKQDSYSGWPYRYLPLDDMMASAKAKNFFMPHDNEAGTFEVDDEDTLTAWTVQKTMRFLEAPPPGPFAVTCSILQPHAPLVSSSTYTEMFDPAEMPFPANVDHSFYGQVPIPDIVPKTPEGLGQFMALYFGLVVELDLWVGKLLERLEKSGLTENTLVIFTSDHGELLGSHRTFSKGRFYEESWRVPLILSYPGVIPAGRRLRAPATGADLAPTILDYCGLKPLEQFHGTSLKGVVEGADPEEAYAFGELGRGQALRSTRWKYVREQDGARRLFDLAADPWEMTDLLVTDALPPEAARVAFELAERLDTEYARTPHRGREPR